MPSMSRSAAAQLLAQAAEQLREYSELDEKYGKEPTGKGAVIRFTRTFGNGDNARSYSYVAIQHYGWWVSGRTAPQGCTWDRLMHWLEGVNDGMSRRPVVSNFEVLSLGFDADTESTGRRAKDSE